MSKRDIAIRVGGGVIAVLVLAWFANANTGERVDVDFLLFTLRDISLSVVLFGAVIVGMLLILAVGLRADLKTRREIRNYRRIAGDLPGAGDSGEGKPGSKRSKVEQKA